MRSEDLRKQLTTLANRSTNKRISPSDEIVLQVRAEHLKYAKAADVRRVIGGIVGETENVVELRLSHHDDSRRILEEIVDELNRK